jgi:hypothetical protein
MAINTTIVTDKAKSVISEGLKNNISIPAGAITPATLTAMVGLAQGGALQIPQSVTDTMSAMTAMAESNPALADQLNEAKEALETLQNKMFPQGGPGVPPNPAAFGQVIMQAQSHISDSLEIKHAMDYMSKIDFNDLGSGITDMASLATQGIDNVVGDLGAAAKALEAAGPLVDMKNPGALGSGAGLVDKLKSVKLANASGVNEALIKNGVDLNNLNSPVYTDDIDRALSSITDPKTIATVTKQLGISPVGTIRSLKDLTDLSKLVPPAAVAGLSTDLNGMATKLNDLGAKFSSPAAASNMLSNLQIPSVPKLNAVTNSLPNMVDSAKSTIEGLTGTGSGPMGLPSMQDFTEVIAGGPKMEAMMTALQSGSTEDIETALDDINDLVSSTQSLMSNAGIDLENPAPKNLGSVMSFGTGLHNLGADMTGSGVADILSKMATDDPYGDAIKLSLIEGKNKMVMAANGIKPLDFSGVQTSNPFAGLPSYAGADSSLNLSGQSEITGIGGS